MASWHHRRRILISCCRKGNLNNVQGPAPSGSRSAFTGDQEAPLVQGVAASVAPRPYSNCMSPEPQPSQLASGPPSMTVGSLLTESTALVPTSSHAGLLEVGEVLHCHEVRLGCAGWRLLSASLAARCAGHSCATAAHTMAQKPDRS